MRQRYTPTNGAERSSTRILKKEGFLLRIKNKILPKSTTNVLEDIFEPIFMSTSRGSPSGMSYLPQIDA